MPGVKYDKTEKELLGDKDDGGNEAKFKPEDIANAVGLRAKPTQFCQLK